MPGHGTTIEDCNSTKYYEWLNAVEKGVAEMYSACDKVIVMGVSMGGVLSLHLGSLFLWMVLFLLLLCLNLKMSLM